MGVCYKATLFQILGHLALKWKHNGHLVKKSQEEEKKKKRRKRLKTGYFSPLTGEWNIITQLHSERLILSFYSNISQFWGTSDFGKPILSSKSIRPHKQRNSSISKIQIKHFSFWAISLHNAQKQTTKKRTLTAEKTDWAVNIYLTAKTTCLQISLNKCELFKNQRRPSEGLTSYCTLFYFAIVYAEMSETLFVLNLALINMMNTNTFSHHGG